MEIRRIDILFHGRHVPAPALVCGCAVPAAARSFFSDRPQATPLRNRLHGPPSGSPARPDAFGRRRGLLEHLEADQVRIHWPTARRRERICLKAATWGRPTQGRGQRMAPALLRTHHPRRRRLGTSRGLHPLEPREARAGTPPAGLEMVQYPSIYCNGLARPGLAGPRRARFAGRRGMMRNKQAPMERCI